MSAVEELYLMNLRLNRAEFAQRRLVLESMPRYLSVVIGTRCNINCPYCYQEKTGDELLGSGHFGDHLRRELAAFYPYLSTFRIGGGEVFLIPGFEELVAEVSASAARPIISISTNGTLIDETWAEKIVRIPFREVTLSIDGATAETYARLRRGASLDRVLANLGRLQDLKSRLGSSLPEINLFYLVMRSNYREIPLFLQLARDHGIDRISFQMVLVDHRNLSREPGLAAEVAFEPGEVRELHDLIRPAIESQRGGLRTIHLSGFQTLFEKHGLETDFLDEGRFSLYPDNEGTDSALAPPAVSGHQETETAAAPAEGGAPSEIELCPNPWTLLYVTESGSVHTCFMARAVGNLHETPLIRLWNAPAAVAARSDIICGRYEAAGCSEMWCSWREGKRAGRPLLAAAGELIEEFRKLTRHALGTPEPPSAPGAPDDAPAAVRRMLSERSQRIAELEFNLVSLCDKNRAMLEAADKQNQLLSARIRGLEGALQLTHGSKVEVERNVRFGPGPVSRFLKKSAIGGAVRSIQALEWAANKLRSFVNWTCLR